MHAWILIGLQPRLGLGTRLGSDQCFLPLYEASADGEITWKAMRA